MNTITEIKKHPLCCLYIEDVENLRVFLYTNPLNLKTLAVKTTNDKENSLKVLLDKLNQLHSFKRQ